MNLPEVFFPAHACPHDKVRDIFSDYGKYMHVDVADTENMAMRTQTVHPGSETNLRLSATTPTLPLAEQTHIYSYPFEDRVSGKLNQKRSFAVDFITRFPGLKRRFSKLESRRAKQVRSEWFSSTVSTYKEFQKHPFVPKVNAAYTGGCLICLDRSQNDDVHLAHAAGQHFDILRLVLVSPNPETELLEQTVTTDQKVDSPIFEVVSSRTGENEFSAVRHEFGYELFKLHRDDLEIVSLDKRSFEDERLTSLALSSYIKGEILVATEKGSVYLVSPGDSVRPVIADWNPRFECYENWRQCYFAAHPRQFVTADRTAVKLFDSRTSFEERIDLFALPNKLLLPSERVMVAKQQTSCAFHHIVATDASMFVIDQRFPGHPLSHWSFSQKSAPQYISSSDISMEDDAHINVVIIGTQQPAEAYCFQIQFGGLSPLQTIAQPWRLSRISDFSKFEKVMVCADMMLLQKRFSTSLVGLAVCPGHTQNSFHAFQLDSQGEVYFQTYRPSLSAVDKTLSAGPGSQQEFLTGAAVHRAEVWLSDLQNKFKVFCSEHPDLYNTVKFNCDFMVPDFLAKHLKHTLCPLCTQESDCSEKTSSLNKRETVICDNCGHSQRTSETVYHGQCSPERGFDHGERVCENCGELLARLHSSPDHRPSQDREFMEGIDRCESCGHSLKVSETLFGIRSKNSIIGGDDVSLELFNRQVKSFDEVPQASPNSQILFKLWHGDTDIMDLVAKREEERKKKLEEQKKLKAEKKGKTKLDKKLKSRGVTSDSDAVESSDEGEIIQSEEGSESDLFDEEVKTEEGHEVTSVRVESLENKLTRTTASEISAVSSVPAAQSESGERILGFYVVPQTSEKLSEASLASVKASASVCKTSSKDRQDTGVKEKQLSDDENHLLGSHDALPQHQDQEIHMDLKKTKQDTVKFSDKVESKHKSKLTKRDIFKTPDRSKPKHESVDFSKTQTQDVFQSPSRTEIKHTSADVRQDQHTFKSPEFRTESKAKRRRYSSSSSERSTHSHSSFVGFCGTPPRLMRKDSLLDSIVPESDDNESLELFSQFDAHSFLVRTLPKISSPSFSSPTKLTKGFQKKMPVSKSKKKHISGF